LSGAAATVAASSGVDMRVWLAAVAIIAVAVTILGRRLIGDGAAPRRVADSDAAGDTEPASPDVEPGQGPTRSKTAILLAALPLAIIAICGSAVEDIANNWAGLAAVRLAGVPAASAGIAFSIVIGSQCLGRFSGDVLVMRFGAGRIARIGGGLIALGGLGAGSLGRDRPAARDWPCRGSDARELADAGRVPRHQSAGRAHRRRGGTALGPEPARDGRRADSGVRAPARPAPPCGELIEAG